MNPILLEGVLFAGFLFLLTLVQALNQMIKKQINEQMEGMIPLKAIRERISIKIKWK